MRFYILITSLIISFFGYCQEKDSIDLDERKVSFHVGLWGHGVLSTITDNGLAFPPEIKPGVDAGISFQYNFSENWALSTDLAYLSRGYQLSLFFTDNQGNFVGDGLIQNKLKYLSVPVMAKYIYGHKFSFSAAAGVYGSYLLEARSVSDLYINGEWQLIDQESSGLESMDFGMVGELGFSIGFLRSKIGLHCRYYQGLANIFNESVASTKSQNIGLTTGLHFSWNVGGSTYSPHKNY